MTPVVAETEDARRQLDRVLKSPGFARNERLSRFLRFVVERRLEGRVDELKESVIAVEVFGRLPDFNPKRDPIVRTEGGRLRARLSEYYFGDGQGDTLVIELPKGGYAPRFRQAGGAPQTNAPLRSRLGKRAWLGVAMAGLLAALAGMAWWRGWQESPPVAIAVLPLTNLSEESANGYFADGLTDEIIRNLSIIEGLAVRSQTSSFAFKDQPRNVREMGKQLDAEYILEGSVARAGQRLRINARLVRVRDDLPVWSDKFDRDLTDVFAIQDEISRGIVNSLRLKLGHGRRRYETSVEAYDLYLRARALDIQGPWMGSRGQSITLFEDAIAKDPSFAPAYAGLAALHALRSGFFRLDHAEESAKMRAAAEKAIQLDPLLAEAHEALGMAHAGDAQWGQSEKSFRRAIELDRSRSLSHEHFATFLLLPLGRIEEAVREMRAAERTDPLSRSVRFYSYYVLLSAGRYEEAAGHCEKAPPNTRKVCLARVRLGQGRIGEAVQILEASPRGNSAFLGYAYARAGRREEAEKLAAGWQGDPLLQAMIFAGLGDKDRTLEALERGALSGPFRVGRALTFPELALLRGDPRVKALRKKVGLPE